MFWEKANGICMLSHNKWPHFNKQRPHNCSLNKSHLWHILANKDMENLPLTRISLISKAPNTDDRIAGAQGHLPPKRWKAGKDQLPSGSLTCVYIYICIYSMNDYPIDDLPIKNGECP